MLSKLLISNFILPSFTTHTPQHSQFCHIHFAHMLLLDWLTFYSIGRRWSNHCPVIQTMEILGNSTVERMRKDHAPIRIELPSSLSEVTALGLADPRIHDVASLIAPALLLDSESRPNSPTDKSTTAPDTSSACSTAPQMEQSKEEDTTP